MGFLYIIKQDYIKPMGSFFLFILITIAWLGLESYFVIHASTYKPTIHKNQDNKTKNIITTGMIIAIIIAFLIYKFNIAALPQGLRYIGIGGMVVFLFLRYWSVYLLGKHFSSKLEVHKDHKLVNSGPYSILRHPAYMGSLFAFTFAGLALGSWLIALILFVLFFFIYNYRIHFEENLMKEQLGKEYVDYIENTYKLIPFIY